MDVENKRVYWIDEEVETMLGIIQKEKDILRQLEGKTRRNNVAYKRIAKGMKLKNFDKSSDQIKSKLRFMKKSYFEVKTSKNCKTCPYFDQLDEMYGAKRRQQVAEDVEPDVEEEEPEDDSVGENEKRVYWLPDEVEAMLEIIRDNDILRQLEGKTKRNNVVYKRISEGLRLRNCYKSSAQIKTKIRFLKKKYFDFKNNKTREDDGKICPYYEQLYEIYETPLPAENHLKDEPEVVMFPDVDPTFDSEMENTSLSTSDDSSIPRKRQTIDSLGLPEAMAKLAEEFKKGVDRITEQTKINLREQRSMNAEFMMNMRQLLEEDRKASNRFLEKLLRKK